MTDYTVPYLQDLASAAAARYGVPQSLFLWQINQESSWNPNAYNYNNGGTPAIGIAQFQPATAAQYGVNPYDPASALDGAARYDAELYERYGTWDSALRHYGTIHDSATSQAAARALANNTAMPDALTLSSASETLSRLGKSLLEWTPGGLVFGAGAGVVNAAENYAQRIAIALLAIVLIGGGVLMFALSTDAGRSVIKVGKSAAKKAATVAVLA